LVLDRAAYPDLYKFKQAILDGSNDEESHRDATNSVIEYWYGNQTQWENVAKASQYPRRDYSGAYKSIGNYLHLTQDATLPAHDRVIFHGYPKPYYVAPGGKLLDSSKYTEVRSDGIESIAASIDLRSLTPTTISLEAFHATPGKYSNTPQPYSSPAEACEMVLRKLWLCDAEVASTTNRDNYASCSAPASRTWGAYSFPTARGCRYPQVGADLDWYPRALSPSSGAEAPQSAHEIGRMALYLAIRIGSEELKRLSRTLPPVMTGPPLGVVADFSSNTTSTFSLKLEDNRTKGVFLSVKDATSGQPIVATVTAPNLPRRQMTLDGSLAIPLSSHMDADLTALPWGDRVTISWNGSLAGGGKIAMGSQSLVVEMKDEDGNIGTASVPVDNTRQSGRRR
jgi:hypothetical protein